ncbi:MAG: ATP-binding protein [Acidobacteriota bacterium]
MPGTSAIRHPTPDFLRRAGRILNSGQARALLLTGNLHDLFPVPEDRGGDDDYRPVIDSLRRHWSVSGQILLIHEVNGPIRFASEEDRERLKNAWLRWRTGRDADQLAVDRMLGGRRFDRELEALADNFDASLRKAIGNPTVAFELLRQLCLCSRFAPGGEPILPERLLIVIEGADLALPEAPLHNLAEADRRRVGILADWFGDPGFLDADDAVVLLAESRSLLNHRVARMPQLLEVEVPAPDLETRRRFLAWFERRHGEETLVESLDELAELSAGLSLQALSQLLKGAAHGGEPLDRGHVVAKVEEFVVSQLGEDVVSIAKPEHTLDDVVGFRRLKAFLRQEMIPRFQASGSAALPGAAIAGPIGSGKTFLFEAVAAELDMVVLTLKNVRSQWFGQTDVLFERLRRVLEALSKVVIFIDEADTQFGGLGEAAHATERRLTGKIQQMMSDPRLRGRVFWLLMTARIHRLSPDIRRPGRVGDLIIPVLDPTDDDRLDFLRWVLATVDLEPTPAVLERLDRATQGNSAAAFAALRSNLKAHRSLAAGAGRSFTIDDALALAHEMLPADIDQTRRYQTLQALVNTTRRSLLPDPEVREKDRRAWSDEIRRLEGEGLA